MFGRLRSKWKVSSLQLALILFTFAIGGSLTGYVSKKIMNLLAVQQDWLWTIIYIILVTLLWPMSVLFVSLFFGQFRFFWRYIHRISAKIGLITKDESNANEKRETRNPKPKINIALFASGAGSNAKKIIEHFRDSEIAQPALIVCNKPGAGVLNIAKQSDIPSLLIERERFFRGDGYFEELKKHNIHFIVLAGFLWKIPDVLIKNYPKAIVNIHPALLPKYGGKGMYGHNVHEAVLAADEKESGITIHYVDEHYDNGDIILQVKCPVLQGDTADSLANRIHVLEHANYPVIIEELVTKERKERKRLG